jgi:hypothetical protein
LKLTTLFSLALGASTAACGTTTSPADATGGEIDATELADALEPDAPIASNPPPRIFPTGGGGAAASASYRAQISIGAPQPMGSAQSASAAARLGPTFD